MSTLNLGKLRFNWRGNYASAQTYTRNDTVKHQNNSYVCIAETTTGTFNAAHWALLAEGMHPATTQGDTLVFENGALTRKPVGQDRQILVANANGTINYEYSRGEPLQVVRQTYTGGMYNGDTNWNWVTGLWNDFTPKAADSRIAIRMSYALSWYWVAHAIEHCRLMANGVEQCRWNHDGSNYAGRHTLTWDMASWGTTTGRIGISARDYQNDYHAVMWHATYYWEGGASGQFCPAQLEIIEYKEA